ncbi:hypothetical protein Anas_00630 [Armadillidium nasatum]|uniref:Spondin-like TSP1 domain-containing protein n=1 Tax=Armadillidium nasatum TaxID=96803 RepID=A0A5N5T1Z8_9CRUS|nr:hypothetical protein Anas_00630 [Armadillidium nasatum]
MCGKGHIVRNITCVDSDGNIAPNEECQIELGTVESRQQCHVPCPFDCVLAPWSEWTPCSKACADTTSVGYTHRNTTILAPNGPGGKECPAPDELTEVKTCREEPCAGAAWVPGEWGVCLPESGSSCGTGSQIRPLFCIDMNTNEQLENFR